MILSTYEQNLIKKIQTIGKGTLINVDVNSLKFGLSISQIQSVGVESRFIWLIGQIVTLIAWENDFECNLRRIVIFPIILNGCEFSRADFISYKKSDNSYFIGTNIDFDAWSKAKKIKRIELALNCLVESIIKIPCKNMDDFTKSKIVNMIEMSANEIQSAF